MARLIEVTETGRKIHELEREVISLGRKAANDVVLSDPMISRRHAEIRKAGGGWQIKDLESRNGVYVNNLKISEEPLAHGDVITIGPIKLLFEDPAVKTPEKPEGEKSGSASYPGRGLTGDEIIKIVSSTSPGYQVEELLNLEEDRKKLDTLREKLARQMRPGTHSALIYKVARELNTTRDMHELFRSIIRMILALSEADRGVIFLREQGGGLVPAASADGQGGQVSELRAIMTLTARAIERNAAILCVDACYQPGPGDPPLAEGEQISSAMCAPIWEEDNVLGAIYLDSQSKPHAFDEHDLDHLTAVANLLAIRIEQEKMEDRIRQSAVVRANLQRFHSPDVVSLIMRQSNESEDLQRFLQEREVTILFADISDFTNLIERLDPQQAAELLSDFFDEMTSIIFKYGGTVDKFIGDAIMANFGAPISHGNDAELAVFAAIEMMQAMEWFKAGRDPKEKFDIRIGINTGMVLTGYMGSKKRIEYSVLGDPVNVAARLQQMAEPKTILIGDDTYAKVGGLFGIKDRGSTVLKGKKKKTRVYEVVYAVEPYSAD